LLPPSLEDATAVGFERVDENSDVVLLRKRAAKGWEYRKQLRLGTTSLFEAINQLT
jgi:hypothetical protein